MTKLRPDELTTQGRTALLRLDRDAAEACFRQALEESPEFVDAVVGLGQVAYERGNLDGAAKHFKRAYDLAVRQVGGQWPKRLDFNDQRERSFLRALHGMGLIFFRQGKGREARHYFTLEHSLDPTDHQGSRFMVRNIRARKSWKDLYKRRENE